jgi:hypothetical protein
MNIITNSQPRDLFCFWDLPDAARSDFDYITGEDRQSPRLFRYRGAWYDAGEFFQIPDHPDWRGLPRDGYQSDRHFSGTLVRYVEDFERVIVARYWA